ncbi:hypothetical protein SLNWT_6051 [Streptomyces albus]|uniref:Uncharacterized protein n=1 Tax=Streptomyces albus (strain ATCC 21838 / DSM 41398 / FERM P-419 / JCM 4703 / NBRC 107858) TaxID=1081613 RepID=A0A0B5F7J6_STRA4|nr:hypothetical protein SLNWT_6051 [Streptomyces albus]
MPQFTEFGAGLHLGELLCGGQRRPAARAALRRRWWFGGHGFSSRCGTGVRTDIGGAAGGPGPGALARTHAPGRRSELDHGTVWRC